MRAVAERLGSLLRRLEEARHLRPGAREAERRLRAARSIAPRDAASLIRFHEALLFLRAYPHSRRVRDLAERLLTSFARRVERLGTSGADLDPFDAPEVAGIAGTTIGTDFSCDVVRFLARRFPRQVRIEWAAGVAEDRMRATWPEFIPLLEEEALADANVPYLDWLGAAAGPRRDDPSWLLRRYESLPEAESGRAERWDSLELAVSWRLPDSVSRTRMRVPGPPPFFHDAPFLARRAVSLDAVLSAPPLPFRRLSRRDGERMCDVMREATAARYREFYTFTYADPASVFAARPGRGVELFLVGVESAKRLPLRSAWGGFVVKNGVPIGYIEGLALADRLEIGFNMYYTFREGESAWIYAQVLKFHRDALGVTSFSIDPYQLGFENEEALESGAFWFYRKLGFRPTSERVRRLVEREEMRIAADPSYRSSRRTLERLVVRNLIYDAPGAPQGDWDRFHVRRLGLAVNRRMRESGMNAARFLERAEDRVARSLRLPAPSFSERERGFFSSFALILDLVPDLSRWSREDREDVAEVVRSRAARDERRYLRLLRRSARLRRTIIELGSG